MLKNSIYKAHVDRVIVTCKTRHDSVFFFFAHFNRKYYAMSMKLTWKFVLRNLFVLNQRSVRNRTCVCVFQVFYLSLICSPLKWKSIKWIICGFLNLYALYANLYFFIWKHFCSFHCKWLWVFSLSDFWFLLFTLKVNNFHCGSRAFKHKTIYPRVNHILVLNMGNVH